MDLMMLMAFVLGLARRSYWPGLCGRSKQIAPYRWAPDGGQPTLSPCIN
jgi:hypothetical protein